MQVLKLIIPALIVYFSSLVYSSDSIGLADNFCSAVDFSKYEKSIDYICAKDDEYRKSSWIAVNINECNYPLHKELAKDVVAAHWLCKSKRSNTAAFGFTLYEKDGGVIKTVSFFPTLSSGMINSLRPAEMNIETVNDFCFGTNRPKEKFIKFLDFLLKNELNFSNLQEVKGKLELADDTSDICLNNDFDVYLGYVKHCEQCFLFYLLSEWDNVIQKLDLPKISEGQYISFDILTYNDICQRCFAGCKKLRKVLENKFSEKGSIPLKIYISSLKPFKILIDKECTCGYTRETEIPNFQEQQNCSQKRLEPTEKNIDIIQFFSPWMFQEENKIEYKLTTRAFYNLLTGISIPFWEQLLSELPTKGLKINFNNEQYKNNTEKLKKRMEILNDENKKKLIDEIKVLSTAFQNIANQFQNVSNDLKKLSV